MIDGGMATLDWLVVLAYLTLALAVGLSSSEAASEDPENFFLAGRDIPWWWSGLSIAATTFAADTPLAVTGIIAARGLSGNWMWLSWVGVHAAAIVLFAGAWNRAGVLTDAELVEVRYSGRAAAILRWARAGIYGVVINSVVLGWVLGAMVKLAGPLVPWRTWTPWLVDLAAAVWPVGTALGDPSDGLTVLLLLALVACYSSLGGLKGVMKTDLVQLGVALGGSFWLAYRAWDVVGGRAGLVAGLASQFGTDHHYLELWPNLATGWPAQLGMGAGMFGAYLVVQSFANTPADSGGYLMQRLAATRSPRDARRAATLFVVIQYLVRAWPWFIVGLAALVLIPAGAETSRLGPVAARVAQDRQLAYPVLMQALLGPGTLGLMVTSLLAAFMSTVDTHLNWGASYLVTDVYLRVRPDASPREQVRVGRVAVLGFCLLAIVVATQVHSIATAWQWIAAIGAAFGAPTALRWVWWRVNATGELAAVCCGLVASAALAFFTELPSEIRLVYTVGASLCGLFAGILFGPPTDPELLAEFQRRVDPPGFWHGRDTRSSLRGLLRLDVRWVVVVGGVLLGLQGVWMGLLRGQLTSGAACLALGFFLLVLGAEVE